MVTRKHRRFSVSMPSVLVQRDQFRHKGSIRDLSAKGCRVESLITPFTGMQVTLLLQLPGEAVPLKIENAAVRWCGSQGIGMEFLIVAEPEQVEVGPIHPAVGKDRPCELTSQRFAFPSRHSVFSSRNGSLLADSQSN